MSYSFSKAIIAAFQAIFSSVTRYQTQGDQIHRFGYAAFGLTVTSYLIMSLVNLLSNMFTPNFPSMYLVKDSVMVEVEKRTGTKFDRVVAEIKDSPDAIAEMHNITLGYSTATVELDLEIEIPWSASIRPGTRLFEKSRETWESLIAFLLGASSLIAIGIITHFRTNNSTRTQRVLTMMWLVFGWLFGLIKKI